jgi:hyperosmotically inducible periplasmic protein
MRSAIGTFVCVAALIGAAPHQATAAPQATATTTSSDKADKAIDAKITRRINADASLKRHHVKVSVDNGVAKLSGTVRTDAERERAEKLAMAAGAARVENRLEVEPNAKGTTGTMERKTKEGAEKSKEGAEKAWDKTKEGASRAGAEVTDGWITTDLKTRFTADDTLRASDIHVDTDHHVVKLSGTVPSASARAHAVALARKINGVTRVVDNLTIRP